MKSTFYLFVFLGVFVACRKERPQLQMPSPILPKTYHKVFILNQGVFPNDNSSVSLFDETQGVVSSDYFKYKNPNVVLGSIPQSMYKINGNYFLVVNYSSKILVLDSNFIEVSQIGDLVSPRFMLPLSNSKAYVTDYSANEIHIINTNTCQKTGSIPCKGWTEQITSIGNMVYVCNYKSSNLYVIDSNTDIITDSINIGKGAEFVVKDKNKNLWILCTSIFNYENKYLYCINPATKAILKSFEFQKSEFPTSLNINRNGDKLFFINKNVYELSIEANALPNFYILNGNAPRNFYALGINPSNENIYVCDSKYGQAIDNIFVCKNNGDSITNFKSGYISGFFYFEK